MSLKNLIGSCKAFRNVIEDINMVAPLDCAVMLQGETGIGKEVVARAIHENGPRCEKPFIAINCAAIDKLSIAGAGRRHLFVDSP